MAERPQVPKEKPPGTSALETRRADQSTGDRPSQARKKRTGPDLSGLPLGDFMLLRRIGSGGMGEVYLAQQISLKRQVALKVLRGDLTSDETALKRFAVEAEAAAKLTHANIVQIYAVGRHEHTHFMALEYVPGMNLREYVAKKGPANARFAVKVMEQVAAAIHHAAEAGVVHRDIKPDNILLTRKGEVKVADFGLARLRSEQPVNLTQTGITMGTPLYMSPEQVEGKPIDSRSDLYSFGVTCYFMLTGKPPFTGETALAVAVQHIKGEPVPLEQVRPDLPPELCRIVKKLMTKDPDQRYQTGRQSVRDLQKLRAELSSAQKTGEMSVATDATAGATLQIPAPRERALRRMVRPETMRRNWKWWLVACVTVATLGGAGYGFYRRAPDLRPRAGDVPTKPPEIPWDQVPPQKTAQAQYDYALAVGQFSNAEAAWTAVINAFPLDSDWVYRAQMQLGRHYLDEHQLDKAEKLFNEMAASSDQKTQVAGEVGKAAVLSRRDRPQESLDALWNVVQQGQIGTDRLLQGMVAHIFERNYRNLGQDWDTNPNPEIRRRLSSMLWQLRPPGLPPQPGGERRTPGS